MAPASISFQDRCPFDILWNIASYLDRDSLHVAYAVNKHFSSSITPLLFSHYTLESYADFDERCGFILKENNALFVHSCRLDLQFSRDSPERLSRRVQALKAMRNLKALSVTVSLSTEKDSFLTLYHLATDNPTFQLNSYQSNSFTFPSQFLSSQKELKRVSLPTVMAVSTAGTGGLSLMSGGGAEFMQGPTWTTMNDVEPKNDINLPVLDSVQATYLVVGTLVPGRPVTRVKVQGYIDSWRLNDFCAIANRSTQPVHHISLAFKPENDVLEDLITLFTELSPRLRTLELDYLRPFRLDFIHFRLFAAFPELESLRIIGTFPLSAQSVVLNLRTQILSLREIIIVDHLDQWQRFVPVGGGEAHWEEGGQGARYRDTVGDIWST